MRHDLHSFKILEVCVSMQFTRVNANVRLRGMHLPVAELYSINISEQQTE